MRPFIAILAVAVLSISACKGKDGSEGPRGPAGLPGPSGQAPINIIDGSVTSNDFLVTDSRIGEAAGILVYVGNPGGLVQLPVYSPGGGYNVLYVITPSGAIEIFNAQLAGFSTYWIVLVD